MNTNNLFDEGEHNLATGEKLIYVKITWGAVLVKTLVLTLTIFNFREC